MNICLQEVRSPMSDNTLKSKACISFSYNGHQIILQRLKKRKTNRILQIICTTEVCSSLTANEIPLLQVLECNCKIEQKCCRVQSFAVKSYDVKIHTFPWIKIKTRVKYILICHCKSVTGK